MKLILKIFVLSILFTSCGQILYKRPQPQKGVVVKSFVDDVRGTYSDTNLVVEILKNELFISGSRYVLTSKTPVENKVLLKYYDDFYFASIADSGYYAVFMAKIMDDKLAVFQLNADELSRSKLQKITNVDTLNTSTETYLINPSKKEFDQLLDYEFFDLVYLLKKQ